MYVPQSILRIGGGGWEQSISKGKFSKRGHRPEQSLKGVARHSSTKIKIQAPETKYYIPV